MFDYSGNAAIAKVHALYGKRLKAEDYNQLLQKKTVGEVAGYLKGETYYASALEEVKEDLVHREQLEYLVRRFGLDAYVRLLKYARGDNLFFRLHVMNSEITQLLLAIRYLSAGSMDRYLISLPAYLTEHLSFDLFALAKIRSYDQLLKVVEESDYYHILGPYRPTVGKTVDITGCETALLTYYYTRGLSIVQAEYSGEARADLTAMLQQSIDLHNLSVIVRLKHFFGADPATIHSHLLRVRGRLSPADYAALLAAGADESLEYLRRMARVTSGHLLDTSSFERVSSLSTTARQGLCRRKFRASRSAPVALLSYMELLQIEAGNIVNIIEGTRYSVPPEEIRQLLVF